MSEQVNVEFTDIFENRFLMNLFAQISIEYACAFKQLSIHFLVLFHTIINTLISNAVVYNLFGGSFFFFQKMFLKFV